MTNSSVQILDHRGQPTRTAEQAALVKAHGDIQKVQVERVIKQYASYVSSLYGVSLPAFTRAADPFLSHPWVYAAAMAIATNIGQAPFVVFRETDDQLKRREAEALKSGYPWKGPRRGSKRRAVQRHLVNPGRRWGLGMKGLQLDENHPLNDVFARPNDVMSGSMLWQATSLFQILKGSCFWMMFGEDGQRLMPGEIPSEIWPLPPELFEPLWLENRLAGWRYRVNKGAGQGVAGKYLTVQLHEVIEHKFINPDPNNFVGGFSPVASLAANINLDLLALELNRATITNGGDPGGILVSEDEFPSKEEEDKQLANFEQRHKGPNNRRRVAILSGGLKYISTGMTNAEMEYRGMREMSRDEILAVMGVPKAVLFVTETLNYATAVTQKKLFWENRLLPMIRAFEDNVDGSGFVQMQPDNVVLGFDLSQIEALRDGLSEALTSANSMASLGLHIPPSLALKTAGLDLGQYPGWDECLLVSTGVMSVSDILEGKNIPLPGGDPNSNPQDGGGGNDLPSPGPQGDDPNAPNQDSADVLDILRAGIEKGPKPGKQWLKIIEEVQLPAEKRFKTSWRNFVRDQKAKSLEIFDRLAKGRRLKPDSKMPKDLPIDSLLPTVKDIASLLRDKFSGVFASTVQSVFDFTVQNDISGSPTFDLSDPSVASVADDRQKNLGLYAPVTLRENLKRSLKAGIKLGETVSQLRLRVSRVYELAGSSNKSLQIARTESAGLMNEARNRMFDAQGITQRQWVTARDENVRSTHTMYGQAGPRQQPFNYLSITGKTNQGVLEFPGDRRAPADEIIGCRCIEIPA